MQQPAKGLSPSDRARSSNHSLAKSHSNGAAITDDTSHNSAGSVAGAITTRIPDTT
jgi:hypothetical protein